MTARSPTRRIAVPRRRPGTGAGPPPATLTEREAALRAGEQASCSRLKAADRREAALDRRERAADRREHALGPREGAIKASAQVVAQIRQLNENLVLTTVDAQTRTEAAERVTEVMSQAAHHDGLTGLPNRALLAERMQGALAAPLGRGHRVAVLFLDLDHFKEINDTLGHPAGDLLLRCVARRLQACVRATDTVCRQGGDEFVILLPEVRAEEDALAIARKVIAAMARAHRVRGHRVFVTASLGISFNPDHGSDAEALIRAADTAMYLAKRDGRNSFRVAARPDRRSTGVTEISAIVPERGPVGTEVMIHGSNLAGVTYVLFGGNSAASFTVISASKVKAMVPEEAQAGVIELATPSGAVQSRVSFTVAP